MDNNSKKILIFSTAYYPSVAGAEVAIKEITDRISDFEFDLVTAKMKKGLPFREKIGNVTVYRLGFGVPLIDKLILPFEGALFARHLQKKNKYSAFWCMMASFGAGGAYIANILNFKKHTPIILTLQEGDSEGHFKWKWFGLINFSWRLALNQTSVLTVISSYLGERARRFGYKGEVELIPNGVDLSKFCSDISLQKRNEIRNSWGFKESDTILITSSRLNVKNGVKDVIRALPLLREDVKFVICGVGELEAKLKTLVKDLKLEDRVVFKGFVTHDDLPKYLKACDIFIRPSLSEGFGLSFMEAFAAKIPVITTPVGGIVDFLKDDPSKAEIQTGYFCKPKDSESIANAVKRVIADPNKNQVLENAEKMVKEKYDWDKIAVQMKGIFDRVQR